MDTEATEPVGEPIEEVGREPPGPAIPCRLITPLRRIACACERTNLTFAIRDIVHWLACRNPRMAGGAAAYNTIRCD